MSLQFSCSQLIHPCIHLSPKEGLPFPGLQEGARRSCGPGQGKLPLQGCEGRSSHVNAEKVQQGSGALRAPVWLLASHLTWPAPTLLVYKGKGQRRCSPRFPSTVGFCDSMTASYF